MDTNNNTQVKKYLFGLENIYTIACIIYVGLVIYYVGTFFTDRPRYGILFFGGSMIIFLLRVLKKDFKLFSKAVDSFIGRFIVITLFFIVIIITYYYWKNFYLLIYERMGSPILLDRILGAIALVLTIMSVYSFSGLPVVIVCLFFLLYTLFGNYFPGIFRFGGFTITRLIDITSVQILRGIWGDLLQIAGTLVAIFIIFSGFASKLGGFDVLLRISLLVAKFSKNLVTQSAIITSAIMGMFTGSGQANVAGTGSFTIPLMKQYNVPSHYAGAIESVASAGGQITPPIMGTIAFLMASTLGIPYYRIALIATLPAILFFTGTAFSVYHISQTIHITLPTGQEIKSKDELKSVKLEILSILIDGLPLFLSLILIIYLLAIVQLHALLVAYYAIIFLVIFTFLMGLRKNAKNIPDYVKKFIGRLIEGAKQSAGTVMQIGLMLSLFGTLIVTLSTSGLASKINFLLLTMGKGQIVPLLIISAILCIIMGCVVSTLAVYVLTTVTVVPALLRLGVEPVISHFYVFWFAMLGLITPPVAPNVIAACRIAGSGFLETAREAMKIGITLFIIPIIMVANPHLLIWSSDTIPLFMRGLVASYSFSFAFYGGYMLRDIPKMIYRILIMAFVGILGFVSIANIPIIRQYYINYLISLGLLTYFIFLYVKFKKRGEVK